MEHARFIEKPSHKEKKKAVASDIEKVICSMRPLKSVPHYHVDN